ncbi:hypothetical protein [Olivibacter sp. XZL3]|uniref:hypothetical protein n=1 Tax=Olivibacter sp. XZL3 TaxID=1735116 RepID=UPI001065C296|nr:hypothetical protein [Olivibacter sp. XZL3]
MKIYIVIGAGLLLSCTSSKLKTKYSTSETTSARSDSVRSETSWRRNRAEGYAEYDALWWLNGNVRWHPDSGLAADEMLLRYRGEAWRKADLLDSQQRFHGMLNVVQQETSTTSQEKQKGQKSGFRLPWWAYVLLLPMCLYVWRRVSRH